MKRILYLSPWAELGGAEAILLDLIQHQNRKRFEPVVVFMHSGSLVRRVQALGIQTEVIKTPRLKNPFSFFFTVLKLFRLIKSQNISLVMSNGGWTQLFGGCAAWLARVPSVWFQHGRPSATDSIERLNTVIPASYVLVNSKFTQELQNKFGNKKSQIRLIYPGIDLNRWRFNSELRTKIRHEFKILENTTVILLPARFEYWKGQIVLLQAAVEVLKQNENVCFVLSGGCLFGLGSEVKAGLEKFILENPILKTKVVFTGHRDDMEALYSAADIVINTSIEPETFGMTIIEAGACERAVIASKHGGALETVLDGETGYLTTVGDSKLLANTLAQLAVQPELRTKLGRNAYERIASEFNLVRMLNDFENCCDQALSGF